MSRSTDLRPNSRRREDVEPDQVVVALPSQRPQRFCLGVEPELSGQRADRDRRDSRHTCSVATGHCDRTGDWRIFSTRRLSRSGCRTLRSDAKAPLDRTAATNSKPGSTNSGRDSALHCDTWILTRDDDPYQAVRWETDFPNLWFGRIPNLHDGSGHVVTCSYWIEESSRTVRCDNAGTWSYRSRRGKIVVACLLPWPTIAVG